MNPKIPKKIACFVEGQTEQIFVERLFQEIAGYKKIAIATYKFQGSKSNRVSQPLKSTTVKNAAFFVLIYDCGSDSHVVSDIKSQHNSLSNNGYEKIIGLRDLYPKPLDEKGNIEKGIRGLLKPLQKTGIPISVILAIMEIEAWFLAEWHHFPKIDPRLSPEFILQECRFDLRTIDVQQRPHPAQDLEDIYQLIGRKIKAKKLLKILSDFLIMNFCIWI
jgi:hypothetical protein